MADAYASFSLVRLMVDFFEYLTWMASMVTGRWNQPWWKMWLPGGRIQALPVWPDIPYH